ncbi:hypothetical protein ACHAXS_005849 [Conticribra weissflogii]
MLLEIMEKSTKSGGNRKKRDLIEKSSANGTRGGGNHNSSKKNQRFHVENKEHPVNTVSYCGKPNISNLSSPSNDIWYMMVFLLSKISATSLTTVEVMTIVNLF